MNISIPSPRTQATSFNRYMVECESVYHMSTFVDNKVLIDTWWNVNQSVNCVWNAYVSVLIDTWWNVNTLKSPDAKTDSTVLIDTWWNVNLFTKLSLTAPLWF